MDSISLAKPFFIYLSIYSFINLCSLCLKHLKINLLSEDMKNVDLEKVKNELYEERKEFENNRDNLEEKFHVSYIKYFFNNISELAIHLFNSEKT